MQAHDPLFPTDAGVAAALSALRPRLAGIIAARRSRKDVWALLRDAGLPVGSLTSFYARVRERGMDGVLDLVCAPEQLDRLTALVANPPSVPRRVAVSTLANQFYCELQVHLKTLHDVRVTSDEMTAGTQGHAAFEAEAEPITDDEIARRIREGEAMGLVEMPLTAQLDGVTLVGRADRIQLEGARARLVLEFKFSSRPELYAPHVVQVEAYGALLEAAGFVTDRLLHAVAVLPRGARRPEGLADQMARRVLEGPEFAALAGRETPTVPTSGALDPVREVAPVRVDHADYTLWVFPHDRMLAQRHIDHALEYWRGLRTPTPPASASKCRACAFNAASLCEGALMAPDGRFEARKIEGSKGTLHVLYPSRRR